MLLAVGALGLGALGAYVTGYGPASKVPASQHIPKDEDKVVQDRQGIREEHAAVSRSGQSDSVLLPKIDGEKVRLVKAESGRGDSKLYVLNKTLEALHLDGARVQSVAVAGGVARIDFNEKAIDGMGSMEESTVIKALQLAMGQFKDVDLLRFTVDGQEVETLGGHFEVTDGVAVVRPATPHETP
jgi:hypothetical protein